MTWTAVMERDGQTSCITFNSSHDADEAIKNIRQIVMCDGFKVLGLVKGDHTSTFYGINSKTDEVLTPV